MPDNLPNPVPADPPQPALPQEPVPPVSGTPPDPSGPVGEPAQGGPPEEAVEFSPFRDALKDRGYPTDSFENDEALLDHICNLAKQVPDLQDAARYAQYVAPYATEIDELIRAREAQAGGPQAPQEPAAQPGGEEPAPYWEPPPEWDRAWIKDLYQDDSDPANPQLRARPNAHPDLPRRYMAYREWQDRVQDRLLSDPAAAIRPGLKEDFESLRKEARQIAREELEAYRQEQRANAFALENQDWLYQQGGDGQPVIDQQTGQPTMTPAGWAFMNCAQRLAAGGLDPNLIPEMAMQMVSGQLPPQAGAEPPTASPPTQAGAGTPAAPAAGAELSPAEASRERFLTAPIRPPTGFTPNRTGTLSGSAQPQGPPQNPNEDEITVLTRAMRNAGLM